MNRRLRRRIGSAPRPNLWRRMCREAAAEIMKEEDKLWMEMACKELNISPKLLSEPTHSTVALERQMLREAQKWPKEIRLSTRPFL